MKYQFHRSARQILPCKFLQRQSLLLVLFFSACVSAIGQHDFRKGFYITNENDSVSVLIDYRSAQPSSQRCVFRGSDGKINKFSPGQIKAYGFVDGKRFTSKKLSPNNDPRFLEQIVNGRMSLYRLKDQYYVETDSMILLKREAVKEVYTNNIKHRVMTHPYKGILNYLLSSCQLTADKVRYSENEFTNLIQNYNRCKGGLGTTYQVSLPSTRFNVSAISGLDVSNFSVEGMSSNVFNKSISPVFGFGIDFSAPRIFDRTSFSIELLYTDKLYQGYQEFPDVGTSKLVHMDYYLDVTLLKMPVSVRYSFLPDNSTPYIRVGIVKYFELKSTLRYNQELEGNGIVTTETGEEAWAFKPHMGIFGGVGYNHTVYNRLKGFVEVRFEKTTEYTDWDYFRANTYASTFSVVAGLRF